MIDGSVLQSVQRCFEKKSRVVVKIVVTAQNSFKVVRLDFWCCESLVILPNSGWLANSSCCGWRLNPVNYTKNLCHIFKQIRLSFDFELYPSLLVAAQTFTLHFFVVVRRRENYRLNWIIASTLNTVVIRNRHKTVLDPAKSNSWSKTT